MTDTDIEALLPNPFTAAPDTSGCLLNHLGDCLALTPESCICVAMPAQMYRDAHKRLSTAP